MSNNYITIIYEETLKTKARHINIK